MVYQIPGNVMKNESKINTYQRKNEISEDIVMPVKQNQKRIQEKTICHKCTVCPCVKTQVYV